MDFRINFQLKDKKPWWADVVFYVVSSLLVVLVFSYGVLMIKNYQQKQEILLLDARLKDTRSSEEKKQEAEVLRYQKKIADFSLLIKNHTFASNVFGFIEKNTVLDVWLKQFVMDQKSSQIQLSGQADSMESFSRQVANLENNEYIKSIGVISSFIDDSKRVDFSFNLAMDPKIFSYIDQTATPPVVESTSPAPGSPINVGPSSEKRITNFRFLLNPGVLGNIDQVSHTITVDVPYGTNVRSLKAVIIVSQKATVSPDASLPLDFSNPVQFEVRAEDASSQLYRVLVNVLPQQVEPQQSVQNQESQIPTKSLINLPAIIFIVTLVLLIIILVSYAVFNLFKGPRHQVVQAPK